MAFDPDDPEHDDLPAAVVNLTDGWLSFEADPVHVARERERARKLRGSAWWQRRLSAGLCAYCGKPFAPRELTMDHIVPVARGGRSTRGNVVPCCKACNSEKKLMTPAELALRATAAAAREAAAGEAPDEEGG